jgi:DNA polymerase elongation subunit (family B)
MKFYSSIVQWGNSILVRGYEKNGPFKKKEEFNPTMYVSSKKGNSKFKLFNGGMVDEISPGSIKETKEFIERYDEVEGFAVHGQTNFSYQYISENFPGEIQYDSTLIRVHFLDIETENEHGWPNLADANEKINLITIYDSIKKHPVTFGWGEFTPKNNEIYFKFSSEFEMLSKYVEWHSQDYPDVMTGWFSNGFDIPYICRRIEKICGVHTLNRLSPWSYVRNDEKMFQGEKEYTSMILGIALIDYLDLYKKFILKPRENYKLDYIAEVELGEKKVDYSEYNSFKEFYENNFQKFTEYNIHDTVLVYKLEQKLKLLDILFTVAYYAKINYEDVFSPVKTWDTIIYNYLRERNVVIPKQKFHRKEEYPGGFVKEPIKGMHKWVVSFDLQSLYPHLIMQYGISPENFVGLRMDVVMEDLVNKKTDLSELLENDYCMTANGWLYRREEAMLPNLMQEMYNLRAKAKKEMIEVKKQYEDSPSNALKNKISSLDNLQHAAKILLNSCYGAVGNEFFRYYDSRMAEGITLSGQLSIMWMERKFNAYLNKVLKTTNVDYVIAIDTDSCYLNLEPLVNEYCDEGDSIISKIDFMDKICKEAIQPFINKCFEELAKYMNAYQQKMFMKRESLADTGIWVAKKKYVLNVYDNEGVRYKEPEVKVTGLQMIQSSTPQVIKKNLKDSLDIIISGDQEKLQEYVLKLEGAFRNYKVEEISKPSGVNGLKKYDDSKTIYTKGTPIHVRGSLLYNHLVKELNLTNRYQFIKDNDKIKFVYLMMPNHIKEDVIAFPSELPVEFELHKYVDYETQFQKIYISPLEAILDVIGWSAYKSNSMGDLFG